MILVRLFRSAPLAGASQTAARSGPLMKKHNALARRMRGRQDDYLRFTRDWRIPPDNNGCECSPKDGRGYPPQPYHPANAAPDQLRQLYLISSQAMLAG